MYQVKEILKMFGISRSTLRYYEDCGILSPIKDPENGYRYFDVGDVQTLTNAFVLRRIGFHSDEIIRFLTCGDHQIRASMLNEHANALEQTLAYTKSLLYETKRLLIKKIFAIAPRIVDCPLYLVYYYGSDSNLHYLKQNEKGRQLLLDFSHTEDCCKFDASFFDLQQDKSTYTAGRCIPAEQFDEGGYGISASEMQRLGGQKCLVTSITRPKCVKNNKEIATLLQYLEENNLLVNGDVFAPSARYYPVDEENKLEIYVPINSAGNS